MRTCTACKTAKPEADFYNAPTQPCKECHRAAVRAHYAATRPERSEYERRRQQDPARRAKKREYLQRHRHRHPQKAKARNALHNAIRDGKINRPDACPDCGTPGPVQAHHHDYAKPLDVAWCCFKCHREKYHGQQVLA